MTIPERQSLSVDIACVGFGPAMGGFLTTLSRGLGNQEGTASVESRVSPGLPPQVVCYERADDPGFGVSGIVTRGRSIRQSFSEEELAQIPLTTPVSKEKIAYLLDPHGASARPAVMRLADRMLRLCKGALPFADEALELPWEPPFLSKAGGFVTSMGQFNQWVAGQVMGSGSVQLWPSTPVARSLIEAGKVVGVQLLDQGTDRQGRPREDFMPGMEIRAGLTVIGDGPVGDIGRQIDEQFGLPEGKHQYEYAVGMKMVVDLPEDSQLEPGTVFHTFGYPEPEIFGFLYVHPGKVASLGIFVPSWFDNPVRTSYRYLQHWMMHPYLWRHLQGATLRSWGAKTLQESGRRGEPRLVGDGYARIGEGSGSTNVLTGSGVDEAWATGVQLAEAVLDLLKEGKSFSKENLEATYVRRRRASWIEKEGAAAEKARDGFTKGFIRGMLGMGLAGLTGGRLSLGGRPTPPHRRIPSLESYFIGRIPRATVEALRAECQAKGRPLHDALMERLGWPSIPYDGKLLMSHQDALLRGGKVQAAPGYADHVLFVYPELCEKCGSRTCIEMCSGEAIFPGEDGIPRFDREKCVHCGACLWNCSQADPEDPERGNLAFRAGAGGLHSAEN